MTGQLYGSCSGRGGAAWKFGLEFVLCEDHHRVIDVFDSVQNTVVHQPFTCGSPVNLFPNCDIASSVSGAPADCRLPTN
jgi:hypothetical protein